jgi:hypothetical protein
MSAQLDDDAVVVAMMNALLLLMNIYIDEEIPKQEQLTEKMRYSRFLFWLRNRHMRAKVKEASDGT